MIKLFLPFIKSPGRLLIASWLTVYFIYCISPIEFENTWSARTTIFVGGFFVFFSTGYFVGKSFVVHLYRISSKKLWFIDSRINTCKTEASVLHPINYQLSKFTGFISIIGLLGSIILVIDLLFLREIDFSQGVSAARDIMNQQVIAQGGIPTGRPWSVVARIFSGFLPVGALITILRLEEIKKKTLIIVLFSLVMQLISETLSGGRNSIFMTVLLIGIGVLLRSIKGTVVEYSSAKLIRRIRQWFLWILIAFIIYALYIFFDREGSRNRTLLSSYKNIQDAFLLHFTFDINSVSQNQNIYYICLTIIYLLIYIVHSLNEINLLISSHFFELPFLSGLYSLFLPSLFLNKLGLISSDAISHVSSSIERTGVYITALGSIYLDFGYIFSFAIFLCFGFITGYVWKFFKLTHKLEAEMLCAYFILTIVISPFYLSLNTGNGFQVFSSLIVSSIWIRVTKMDDKFCNSLD